MRAELVRETSEGAGITLIQRVTHRHLDPLQKAQLAVAHEVFAHLGSYPLGLAVPLTTGHLNGDDPWQRVEDTVDGRIRVAIVEYAICGTGLVLFEDHEAGTCVDEPARRP